MIIDNGTTGELTIPGLFSGACGLSAGKVAFTPAAGVRKIAQVYRGTLDGKPVVLSDVQPAGDGRSYTAQVHG